MPTSAPDEWLPPALLAAQPGTHIVIAMSGGVDSSVAAWRIKQTGLRCSALFMKNWNEPTDDGRCRWEDDVADALRVCDALDIPLNTVDLSAAYWDQVFADFLAEYRAGRTPNPDVLCNREIKFKAFRNAAQNLGGDVIATGHYVRSACTDGHWRLRKSRDTAKDQSYFLYTLGQTQLSQAVFPVGGLTKTDVRQMARRAGLATHEKKDSTGICFIGERPFRAFLSRYVAAAPGAVRTLEGAVIGQHHGAVYYTIGQRQGLGIGGVRGASEAAWFVAGKDLERNELIVVQGNEHTALMSRELTATSLSWVAGTPPPVPLRCRAKTRYRQLEQDCVIESLTESGAEVRFTHPQRAVTPGQSVVFYADEDCIGGGIIAAAR